MTCQQKTGPPILVPLAADIDITNCQQVYDQLSLALIGGAPVVIADLTLTTFCDCATLHCLLAIQHQAADRHAEFRVAVPLASPVRRIMRMTGLDEQLRLYPTAAHAAAASPVPAPRLPRSWPACRPSPRGPPWSTWAGIALIMFGGYLLARQDRRDSQDPDRRPARRQAAGLSGLTTVGRAHRGRPACHAHHTGSARTPAARAPRPPTIQL